MPLPASDQPWPPASWKPFANDIAEAAAWYSGDEEALAGLYGGLASAEPRNRRGWKFWGPRRRPQPEARKDDRLHVPIAADIATMASDLLFGEPVTWQIPEAHGDEIDPDAVRTEARLLEIAEADGWDSTLLEAAELASGLGGVYLRPAWDPEIADHPLLTVVQPDVAIPEFRHGQLVAVTFWRVLEGGDKGEVWRVLERYEPGTIEYGLYVGTSGKLGNRRSLMDREETARFLVRDETGALASEDTMTAVVDLRPWGITGLLPRYIPNALPNRKRRTQPVGRADTAGVEQLMDALDEAWSSWVRDLRLGKARLVVPDEFLTRPDGQSGGAYFDPDQEVFSPLQMDPAAMDRAGITPVQFAIRNAEHEATCRALATEICQAAGYSPQSFGLPGNGAQQTATEVDARTDRSTATTGRKQGYFRRELALVSESVLAIDAAVFRTGITPMRPKVKFAEAVKSPLVTAQTVNMFAMAGAVSIETKVRMAQPDLGPEEVAAEVERIQSEQTMQVGDPTGFGV